MKLKRLLKNLDFSISEKEKEFLKVESHKFKKLLEREIENKKIIADVFIGGSFARGTLIIGKEFDIDIFIRFDKKYKNLSEELKKILTNIEKKEKIKFEALHGSRNYFKYIFNKKISFEIIPVLKIKKISEAKNITDLSYFHASYVKKKLKKELIKEINLAKQFCKAQGVYGAESYINGFSGYALECLMLHYKTLKRMLEDLVKVKGDEKKIIDIENHYKNKKDIFIEINENKIKNPIILIDPTWKERNVLAALSLETFNKFQEKAKKFLKNPSENYFVNVKVDIEKLKDKTKKRNAEFLHLALKTDKQEGDIAGTKMKKFSNFILQELEKYFKILEREFFYQGLKNKSDFYIVVKSKNEVLRIGPPIKMKKEVENFKRYNKIIFEKNKRIYAKIKIDFSAKEFLNKWKEKNGNVMKEMDIVEMKIIND